MQPEHNDIIYKPAVDGLGWVKAQHPSEVLVFGRVSEERAAEISAFASREIRATEARTAARELHNGAYVYELVDGLGALIVHGAQEPDSPRVARYRTDNTHLGYAQDFHTDSWAKSEPFLDAAVLSEGAIVKLVLTSEVGRVRKVGRVGSTHHVTVDLGPSSITVPIDDLEKLDGDPSSPEFWLRFEPADAAATATLLTWLKLRYPLSDYLYSFAATKTIFKPYQFIPALKILTSPTGRLLIADEVGLGKTIEAGLIWTELEQREPIRRGLVVVPASLRYKWQREMKQRFMRPLNLLRLEDLRNFVHDLRNDEDPDLLGIISIESLRSDHELLSDLAELKPAFDLVIVDEAHILRNKSSKSYSVGELLSDWADYLVFLSATPLNLGEADLFNLVNLLDGGGFHDPIVFAGQLEPNQALNQVARIVTVPTIGSRSAALKELDAIPAMGHGAALSRRPDFKRLREILAGHGELSHSTIARVKRIISELNTLSGVLSRTRRADLTEAKALRVPEQVDVVWTEAERAFYDAVYEHYRQKALHSTVPAGFMMQMPLRQASSCISVAQSRLLSKEGWEASDGDGDTGYDYWNEDESLELSIDNDEWLESATDILRKPILVDSKLEALREKLRAARARGMHQFLIFSFFRGTVEYLASNLRPEFTTAYLHGGVKAEDRETIMEQFRDGVFDILISNQVGSEGLDFEFCNVLVNYDLPWNPMQVEQRIGRLDRFGQNAEKIFIFNMHVPGTIESDIIGRLYSRIGVFERSIGDLEPIMRSTMQDLNDRVLNPKLSLEQMEIEINRLAIAAETKQEHVRKIEESGGVLTTVGQLEIDGLTDDGPTSGRFIGPSELERLLREVVLRYEGSVSDAAGSGLFTIRGTHELARELRDLPRENRGTSTGTGRLSAKLRDGADFLVALRPEDLQNDDIELITANHPLLRLAVRDLAQAPHLLHRFGAIRLHTPQISGKFLARVDIVDSHGIRDTRELWVTAIDLDTGAQADSIEDALMTELALGTLEDCSRPSTAFPREISLLHDLVSQKFEAVRAERQQDNEALIDARIESEQESVAHKLRRAQDDLRAHLATRAESSRSRMFEGRIRNLSKDLDDVAPQFATKRKLSMSRRFEAIVYIES